MINCTPCLARQPCPRRLTPAAHLSAGPMTGKVSVTARRARSCELTAHQLPTPAEGHGHRTRSRPGRRPGGLGFPQPPATRGGPSRRHNQQSRTRRLGARRAPSPLHRCCCGWQNSCSSSYTRLNPKGTNSRWPLLAAGGWPCPLGAWSPVHPEPPPGPHL